MIGESPDDQPVRLYEIHLGGVHRIVRRHATLAAASPPPSSATQSTLARRDEGGKRSSDPTALLHPPQAPDEIGRLGGYRVLGVLGAGGIALPNAPALALTRHGEAAGTASAVVGAAQFGIGAVAAPLVGVLGTDALAMAGVVAGGMILALGTLLLSTRSPRVEQVAATA